MSPNRKILGSNRRRSVVAVAGLLFSVSAVGLAQNTKPPPQGTVPTITITTVPPDGAGPQSWGQIAGKTTGANPDEHQVVLYVLTNQWYVQPWVDKPITKLGKGGTFQSGTHLGHTYAALLVDHTFKPPATLTALPPLGGSIIAEVQVPAQ
jgi:hypothetical protein